MCAVHQVGVAVRCCSLGAAIGNREIPSKFAVFGLLIYAALASTQDDCASWFTACNLDTGKCIC